MNEKNNNQGLILFVLAVIGIYSIIVAIISGLARRKADKAIHDIENDINALEIDSNITEQNIRDELVEGSEAWDSEVSGDELFNDLSDQFNKYLSISSEQATALSLYTMFTYFYKDFQIAPRLLITANTKRAGKTLTLEILSGLVKKSLVCSSITNAALFRSIETYSPTLCIDEYDAITSPESLRGLVNAGHTRSSAYVIRSCGSNGVKRYNVFGCLIIAMIGLPASTIVDRSIVIEMKTKNVNNIKERLPLDLYSDLKMINLRRKCRRFADDHHDTIKLINPDIPNIGSDRCRDNFYPLLSIASFIGNKCEKLAIESLNSLVQNNDY